MLDGKVTLIFHPTNGHMRNETTGTRGAVNVLTNSSDNCKIAVLQ